MNSSKTSNLEVKCTRVFLSKVREIVEWACHTHKIYKKNRREYRWLAREWDAARSLKIDAKGSRVLIVPSDPWSVVGSRGDQAMITAIVQHVHESDASIPVDIISAFHKTDDVIREMGINPVVGWIEPFAKWIAKNAANYVQVYILGADVTDGIYDFRTSMKLLMFYDVFTHLGIETRYMGCSWSEAPHYMMKRVLRKFEKRLPLPVRDSVSLARLERYTSHRPLLPVADVAFMMKPKETARTENIIEWCKSETANKRRVIALNVHSMFNDVDTKRSDWKENFLRAIAAIMKRYPEVSILFIAHDNRPGLSDLEYLTSLYTAMPVELLSRCRLVEEVLNADEIKAIMSYVDGLVAGRMHISIAALGNGVPVFALVYQGKFEGLWAHFELPTDTIIKPKVFLDDPQKAEAKLLSFVSEIDSLRRQIKTHLPRVLEKAALNFTSVLPSAV